MKYSAYVFITSPVSDREPEYRSWEVFIQAGADHGTAENYIKHLVCEIRLCVWVSRLCLSSGTLCVGKFTVSWEHQAETLWIYLRTVSLQDTVRR